jgi:hypothetical protein
MTAPHLARRRDYPDFVKTAEATTHDEGGASFRTILHVVFTDGEGVGVLIGANPSRALGDGSDATVNKVLRWFRAQGVREVFVFNLSPYRATDAKDARRWLSEPGNLALSERVNAVAVERLEAQLLVAAPLVLAGWGDCLGTHVDHLTRPWRRACGAKPVVYHLPLTKAGNPTHPLYAKMDRITSRRGLP